MDLRSLGTVNPGTMHLDNIRLGGNVLNNNRATGGSLASFEEMLRNTVSGGASDRGAPANGAVPAADYPALLATPASSVVSQPVSEAAAPPPAAATEVSRAAPRGVVIDRNSELFQQCLELEIFLVKQLISSMRSTIQRSGLIEQSFAGEMYEDMLFDEYARHLATNANFGLAELAYLELTGQRGRVVLR